MKFYYVKTPRILKFIFKNWIWSFSKSEKTIYLTFDDGPTPEITTWVLKMLEKYKAKATFFCIGKNVSQHPEIFQQIAHYGHAIGNHTNNHLNGWKTIPSVYLKSIQDSEKCFENAMPRYESSQKEKLFRPPYGKISLSQSKNIRKKGFKIILWDVLSRDFDAAFSKENCLKNVLKNAKNGSIIVFHDSVKAGEKLKYVLPKVLEYYTKKGYEFKKIT